MINQKLKILHTASSFLFLSELSISSWSVPALTTRVICILGSLRISYSVKYLAKNWILLDLNPVQYRKAVCRILSFEFIMKI